MDVTVITQPLGAYLPNLLGALVVLIVGWLIAVIVSSVLRGALRRTNMDDRLARSLAGGDAARPINAAEWISRAAYYLILLFVLVAFFQVLGLTVITDPLNRLLVQVFQFLPRLAGAAILLLIAWVVATVLRLLVTRGLQAARVDERIGRQAAAQPAAAPGEPARATSPSVPLSRTLGDVVYWLVFLLFLPLILSALELQGLLGPVQTLLDRVLGFLPNLFAAGLILVIGWFIARIVQQVVTNLTAAIGVDQLSQRVGLGNVLGQQRLSSLLGLIVYILILIPVLIAALDALQLTAITLPASAMLNQILSAIPAIFSAALVLVIAYVVGRVVAGLVTNLLTSIGFNSLPARLGLGQLSPPPATIPGATAAVAGQPTPARVAGSLVMVGIMLFAAIQALRLLGFVVLADLVTQFTELLGRVILGLILFAIGLYLANVAARAVRASGAANAGLLARVAQAAILVLAGAIALREMGLANEIINLAFGLLLGAIAVAAALAFGLGGRESASRLVEQWRRSLESERPGPGAPPV